MTLRRQLHVGKEKLSSNMFNGVKNRMGFPKPIGGLWTSSFDEKFGSDWVQWCLGEEWGVPEDGQWKSIILTPSKSARIYHIDNYQDLEKLMEKYMVAPQAGQPAFLYSLMDKVLDFEKLSKEYDGIHLTAKGQCDTRFSDPYNLYGWDCESTVWLNFDNVFEKIEYIGKKNYKSHYEKLERA